MRPSLIQASDVVELIKNVTLETADNSAEEIVTVNVTFAAKASENIIMGKKTKSSSSSEERDGDNSEKKRKRGEKGKTDDASGEQSGKMPKGDKYSMEQPPTGYASDDPAILPTSVGIADAQPALNLLRMLYF